MTYENYGVLIIATGNIRYAKLAINLAKSIRLNCPFIPIAVVSDHADLLNQNPKLFQILVQPNSNWGFGFEQKLKMYDYSPFQKTLFIDADCLVVRDIIELFRLFNGKAVSVLGHFIEKGNFIGTTVEKLTARYGEIQIPTFNGGVYYFEKTELSEKIFRFANKIFYDEYDSLGLIKFNGNRGDEPVMAISMAVHGMTPVSNNCKWMYTPVGQSGVFEMDILKQYCVFFKHGIRVTPAIMHFGGGYPEAFHYRREVRKLDLHLKYKFPKFLASFIVNATWNTVYAGFVFFYRLLKSMIGKAKWKFSPLLPMFKFE